MTGPARRLLGRVGLAWVVVAAAGLACTLPGEPDLAPRPRPPSERGVLPGDPPQVVAGPGGVGVSTDAFQRLSHIFYSRLANRRFNSIATYHDPALREFFRTPEAYSDYFAEFSEALVQASFEALRPTQVQVERLDVQSDSRIQVTVLYTGENARPLRPWSSRLRRQDQWERFDGRWWLIPGKL